MAFQKKALRLVSTSSQYASIADGSQTGLEITGSKTWMTWFKPSSVSLQVLMAKVSGSSGVQVFFDTTYVQFYCNGLTTNSTINATISLVANKWYHVAGVYDSANSQLRIYINGVLMNTLTASGSTTDSNATFYLGRNDSGNYFNGVMAHSKVFNVAMDAAAVQSEMLNFSTLTSGVQGFWKLNGDVTDASTNANNLTASNSPIYIPDVPFSTVNNSDWSTRKFLTIPSAKVTGSSNLTNFKTLLKDAVIPSTIYAELQTGEVNDSWLMEDSSLKAYYRFESGALTTDSSGNGKTLTNNNTVTSVSGGKFGNQASLASASSQSLSINDNLGITSGVITINAWIDPTTVTADDINRAAIISHYDDTAKVDYRLGLGTTGLFAARHAPNVSWNATNQKAISTGLQMITLVYDGTNISLYHNGELFHQTAASSTGSGSATTATKIGIGASPTGSSTYYNGKVDDVAILNRALSQEEIKSLYYGGADLRITSDEAGTTELPFEIVKISPAGETSQVWFSLPTLYHDQDSNFYVWSGNNRATPYSRGAYFGQWNTWQSNFSLVDHLEDATTSGTVDSTINQRSGTKTSAGNPAVAAGVIGNGQSFSSDLINYGDYSGFDFGTGEFAIFVYARTNITPGDIRMMFGKLENAGSFDNFYLAVSSSGYPTFIYRTGATPYDATYANDDTDNVWRRYVAVRRSTGIYLYRNGVQVASNTNAAVQNNEDNSDAFVLGSERSGTTASAWSGELDELMVWKGTAPSADWIATEYTMLNSPDTFVLSRVNVQKALSYLVRSSQSIQKDLDYLVKLEVLLNKALGYTLIRTISAITKTLDYSIVPDANTILKTLLYMIFISVGIQKDLAYRILLTDQITKDLAYAVISSPDITLDMVYAILLGRSVVEKTLEYRLSASTKLQLPMMYHVGEGGYIYYYTSRGTEYEDYYT